LIQELGERYLARQTSAVHVTASWYARKGTASFAHEPTHGIFLEGWNRLEADPFLKRKPKWTRGATPCLLSSGSCWAASSRALSRDFSRLAQITRAVSSSRPRRRCHMESPHGSVSASAGTDPIRGRDFAQSIPPSH